MVQGELDHPIDLPQQQDDLVDPHTRKIAAQREQVKILEDLKETRCCGCIILTVGVRWMCVILGVFGIFGAIDTGEKIWLLFLDESNHYSESYEHRHSMPSDALKIYVIIHFFLCLFTLFHCLFGIYYLILGNCEIDVISINEIKKYGIYRFGKIFHIYYFYFVIHYIVGVIIYYYTAYDGMISYTIIVIVVGTWQRNIKQYIDILERFGIEERICIECDNEIAILNKNKKKKKKKKKNKRNKNENQEMENDKNEEFKCEGMSENEIFNNVNSSNNKNDNDNDNDNDDDDCGKNGSDVEIVIDHSSNGGKNVSARMIKKARKKGKKDKNGHLKYEYQNLGKNKNKNKNKNKKKQYKGKSSKKKSKMKNKSKKIAGKNYDDDDNADGVDAYSYYDDGNDADEVEMCASNNNNNNNNNNSKRMSKENSAEIQEKILSAALMIHNELKNEEMKEQSVNDTAEGDDNGAKDNVNVDVNIDDIVNSGNVCLAEQIRSDDDAPPAAFAVTVVED